MISGTGKRKIIPLGNTNSNIHFERAAYKKKNKANNK